MSTASPTTVPQTIQWTLLLGVMGLFAFLVFGSMATSLYHRGKAHMQLAKTQDSRIKRAAMYLLKKRKDNQINEDEFKKRAIALKAYEEKVVAESRGDGDLSKKITNEIAEGFVAPTQNSHVISKTEYGLFHTGMGRLAVQFDLGAVQTVNQFLVYALGNIFGYWSSFLITNTCSGSQNECFAALFFLVGLTAILGRILQTQTEAFANYKLSENGYNNTFVAYTEDDKQLSSREQQTDEDFFTAITASSS